MASDLPSTMMRIDLLALLIGLSISLYASQAFQQHTGQQSSTLHRLQTKLAARQRSSECQARRKCNPCDEQLLEDVDLDRREATFALIGSIWAAGMLPTSLVFPQAADAAYGQDARIELPNPIQSMSDRVGKQCLVETLGNRECLVYADDANKLYQGADNSVLLARLEKASSALATLPELIESRKWSKVSGVMTGPMGEVVRDMGLLSDLSSNADAARAKVKLVKSDLYAIQAAVDRKDGATAQKFHQAATKDLVAFVKAL